MIVNMIPLEFAGLQCQVQYGDFQEDKHKPGMIDPSEFLPKGRSSGRGLDAKILKEHRKHRGLSELDAKHLYTKTARDLPTYGVTFFLVKEKQKGKKKLVPRLLGINAESILRLNEETKEILQVWPLTQVKTYHAGKSESFTLNFGDYSDKEYSVKTNDAHRIRDILQGYIDIIKKRMDAQYNLNMTEHHAIMEDHVEASRGLTMEHVSHGAGKAVQETFVGPSRIISYEPGQNISQGTQIVTVQQVVITAKGTNQQNVVAGEVPLRKDMSMDFVRKLNRLNSNSVKIVTFLTEPSDSNVAEARILVETMQTDMPSIEEGVNAAAQKQGSEDAKKKLLDELRELRDLMKALTDATVTNVNPEKGQEAARSIADLSTQMYFSLDPRTIKRGEFCRRSRKSFMQDDRVDATLRRASFIAAAHTACSTIDHAKTALDEGYDGPIMDGAYVEELEKAAEDKMGKLNAAVALYLTAYADPNNVDYSAAVTSMNTINELLPELTKDAQRLSAMKDGKARQELLDQMRALCDAAKKVCLITKPEDHEKIQEAAKDYGRASEKLLFTFKRMKNKEDEANDKQDQLTELAREVGLKTSLLLAKANELAALAPDDARASELDDAGVRCADAAKDLLACVTLTAPCTGEPHCQSALAAAGEALAARAQQLAACCKPLAEALRRRDLADDLRDRAMDLAKALDTLKAAFAALSGSPQEDADSEKAREGRRLKFVTTLGGARKRLDDAQTELDKPFTGAPVQGTSAKELQKKMAERIAQLNAALAALVAATADRNKPDYATADLAVATITELMPEIVKDGKALSAGQDEAARAQTLADLKALCDATRDICASSEHNNVEDLHSSAAKFANTSGKMFYVFNPRANQNKEHEILDLSSSACEKASQMLAGVYQLAAELGGDAGAELDAAGSSVADAANTLLTTAQLTAPCMRDPRCQSALASSADALWGRARRVSAVWVRAQADPRFRDAPARLQEELRALQQALDSLRRACYGPSSGLEGEGDGDVRKEGRRLNFISTVRNANKKLNDAEEELNKPIIEAPVKGASMEELKKKMADRIAQLNAALAALVAASADRSNPDYAKADEAVATITELMPQIVKDGKVVSAGQDEEARAQMLADLKALCDATKDICECSERGDVQALNKTAAQFGNTSGKLLFVFNPRANHGKLNEIMELCSSASQKASKTAGGARHLAGGADGAPAQRLRAAGGRLADAADALLASAQLTAACVQDPQCQASLAASVQALSAAARHVASALPPVTRDPRRRAAGGRLEHELRDLHDELDRLRAACRAAGGISGAIDEDEERRRLKFITNVRNANKKMDEAETELNKPLTETPVKGASMEELKQKMADRIAQLNAALADLVAASADHTKPDYVKADEAVATITELMPQIIKDGKAVSVAQDENARAQMLADLKALCDATRDICESSERGDPQALNKSAVKFGNSSGKLLFVFNPRANQGQQKEVMELSLSAWQRAGALADGAQRLAGPRLAAAARALPGAADALRATAQLTAASLQEPRCQAALSSSVEALGAAARGLAAGLAPLLQDPRLQPAAHALERELRTLQEQLDSLKRACGVAPTDAQEKRRLQFVSAAAAAHRMLEAADKELDKPVVAAKGAGVRARLAEALARLAAAAAALVAHAADRDNPDYTAAEEALGTLNQCLPQVVKDMKSVSGMAGSDSEAARRSLLADARELSAAARALCAAAAQPDTEELNGAAGKFTSISGKLVYAFNSSACQEKEHEILDLSSSTCEKASQMLSEVYQLAAEADPEAGSRLDIAGSLLADRANALLATAQLTSPSIHHPGCRASLLSSAEALSAATEALAVTWAPVVQASRFQASGDSLRAHRKRVQDEIDSLKKACCMTPSGVEVKHLDPVQERQRLQFVNKATEAEASLLKSLKELDKPIVPSRAEQPPAGLQSKLAQSLAQLNAAIAALLAAASDRDNPNYDEAVQAVQHISQLMPQVIKETKSLCATKEEPERQALVEELRAACDATRGICASLRDGDMQDAAKFATKAANLAYVVSPQQRKQHRITELSLVARQKASLMVSQAHQLAEEQPDARDWLLAAAARTAHASDALTATAQVASSCPAAAGLAALRAAAAALRAAGGALAGGAAGGAAARARLAAPARELAAACAQLGEISPSKRAPPPPSRTVSQAISADLADQMLAAGALPGAPGSARDLNKEFLDITRMEESQGASAALADAKNKALHKEFVNAVDAAALKIKKAEEIVNKLCSANDEVMPVLSVDQTLVAQKQMEQKLAMAGVAVSNLIACNHPEAIDLPVATKITTTLSDLMSHIVQDAKLLRGSLEENERKAFFADIIGLCEATKKLLESATSDRKKMDKSAVDFANKTAKLLYVVSTDVDPSQEKEVVERVRVINESASRVAEAGAEGAAGAAGAAGAGGAGAAQLRELCARGARCAQAATTLAYTAKLVAPSIQNSNSHEALSKACSELSDRVQAYSSTWACLDPSTAQQLRAEAGTLETLLELLRKDLASGKLVKRRAVERVVVEDTPLRQLASVLLEGAKKTAESVNTPPELRVKYAKYANEVSRAIRELDVANHRCRQAPHDKNKRQDLEYAVQNLQMTLLQTRPSLDGRPQNNIVDLTDYVKDVENDTDQLKNVCNSNQPELQLIKEHCEKMSSDAARVMSPPDSMADGYDDIQEVDQFAQACEKRVKAIISIFEGLPDGKLKIELQEKATRLSDDCNMLRFATKSALATSRGVALDAALDDLTDLESRIDEIMEPGDNSPVAQKRSASPGGLARLRGACVRAAAPALAPAFADHVHGVRAATDRADIADLHRSKSHLKKVLHLIRVLTMTTSRHVATWQKLGHPESAAITGQIIQELDDYEKTLSSNVKAQKSALSEVDMNKLLFPAVVPEKGDQMQLSEKLDRAASKLCTAASAVVQSAPRADALARSAHAATEAALALAAVSAAVGKQDTAQSQKIDEATKEMTLQTYNVLKAADAASQEPNNYAARRRLLDACRLLNDAINQLVRLSSPRVGSVRRECGEAARALQLKQEPSARALQPPLHAPYAHCLDAMRTHADVIHKLNIDDPMSREEFCRTLNYVTTAVCNSNEYAAQCAYLVSIAEQNKELALEGFVDSTRVTNLSEAVQDTCHRIIRTDVEQAKEEEVILSKQVQDLQHAIAEARDKCKDAALQQRLAAEAGSIDDAVNVLHAVVHENRPDRAKITSWTIRLVDAVKSVDAIVESASVAPEPKNMSSETRARCDDILNHSRTLHSNMLSLVREVGAADDADPMTWVTFGTNRKAVLDAFEALLNSVKENGKRAEVLEKSQSDLEEEDAPKRSYVQIQLDLANKWLRKPTVKEELKAAGNEAAQNIIQLGEMMAEDLKGVEQEENLQLIAECKALLADCNKKYDQEKASALMERLKELKKSIERGVVTRVVEDFLEGEEPLADLDILADAEKDESKRKFLLERKIGELLAHLQRVARTARATAGAGGDRVPADLLSCTTQAELLAPMLVKAAEQRVASPEDQAAIEHYQKLLAQYAESLANVRSLCDQAVDPMEFVQTAGECMQRMREESNHENDPKKCAYASTAITKLANRVITVSLSSNDVRRDPELQNALKEAKERLRAAVPAPNARASRVPDWKDTTAEILRTTGEVESVLGGEIIFKKQQGADQPIFAAAFDLHTAVREWSARDNDIVAAAKRMAVLMAKLSDYMNADRKRELLATTKSIVAESHEVANLARKLAHECTDVRIKINLLQVCERIPTISGQLKMLATVKGSTLGHQEIKEDQEAMIMLVGNAQNLMMSVQEVVKAAASATVKIASQRGGSRMRWVRKNYY